MSYAVTWKPAADDELAELWYEVRDEERTVLVLRVRRSKRIR
jgi:hypothetical protein